MAQLDRSQPARYTCQETFARLDDYLDRELRPEETHLVKEHLEVCALCAAEFAFEASVLNQLKAKLRRVAAPPSLLDKVARALEQTQQAPVETRNQ